MLVGLGAESLAGRIALTDLNLAGISVVHGGKDRFPLSPEIDAVGAAEFLSLAAPSS